MYKVLCLYLNLKLKVRFTAVQGSEGYSSTGGRFFEELQSKPGFTPPGWSSAAGKKYKYRHRQQYGYQFL